MDWIKKNYDQFLLIIFAAILLVVSILLILRVMDFHSVFSGIQGQVTKSTKIEPLDTAALEKMNAQIAQPPTWTSTAGAPALLAAEKYALVDGKLQALTGENSKFADPIPNAWLLQYDLDPLNPDIKTDDPDKDGFTNLEEYTGGINDVTGSHATDPTKAESHPPYTTKLFLERYIQKPFLIQFRAQPDKDTFQINIPGHRSQFVHVGDPIEWSKFKVASFEPKTSTTESGTVEDISELTIEQVETGEKLVLIKGKMANSPDSYALFSYRWNNTQFPVKKDKTFTLKPDEEIEYKLVDIDANKAVIENLKTKERLTIPKAPLK